MPKEYPTQNSNYTVYVNDKYCKHTIPPQTAVDYAGYPTDFNRALRINTADSHYWLKVGTVVKQYQFLHFRPTYFFAITSSSSDSPL